MQLLQQLLTQDGGVEELFDCNGGDVQQTVNQNNSHSQTFTQKDETQPNVGLQSNPTQTNEM